MKIYLMLALTCVIIGAWAGFTTPADRPPDDLAQHGAPSSSGVVVIETTEKATVAYRDLRSALPKFEAHQTIR